jgi:hypothetical protein
VVVLTVLGAIGTAGILERRLGRYNPAEAGEATEAADAEAKFSPEAEGVNRRTCRRVV